MRRISALFVVLAACDSSTGDDTTVDAKPMVDALIETTCMNPVATMAADTVNLSGTIVEGSLSGSGLAGVTVAAFGATGTTALATTTSESTGIYQLSVTTGGVPIDYLQMAATGYEAARYYPRAPFAKSSSVTRLPLMSTADFATYLAMFGTQDNAKGAAIVTVADCQGSLVDGAVISVAPPGTAIIKYLHSDGTTTGTATDTLGLAVILNLAAGSQKISATAGGQTLHPRDIAASPSYVVLATLSEK